MWYLGTLKIKNLLSHEDSEFNFKEKELTLIFGENKDDQHDGSNSNGSGKSTIIEGIVIAFTGESYREINKDEFIKDGEKNCSVSLSLKNPVLKETLEIDWFFEKRKTSVVKIKHNGVLQEKLVSVEESKNFIYEKIGLSKEDLLNYYIINQGNDSSFFTSTDAKQKQIITRFIDYNSIDKIINEIEKEKSLISEKIKVCEDSISNSESNILMLEGLIEEKREESEEEDKDEIKKQYEDEIENYSLEIKRFKSKILEEEFSFKEKNKSLEELGIKIKSFNDLLKEGEEVNELHSQLSNQLRKTTNLINQLNTQKDGNIKCPKCNHEFLLGEEKTIEEIDKEIISLEKSKKNNEQELKKTQTLIDEFENVNEEINKFKKEKRFVNNELYEIEERIASFKRIISKNNTNIVRCEEMIAELLKPVEEDNEIKKYEERILESKESIKKQEKEISSLKKESDDKDFWLTHLGKKGFQTYLVNKRIKLIEHTCNSFLEKMKVNIRVIINGYRVLSNGSLREKIEILVSKNGSETGKFHRYSGGQKQRIKLAGILTLHSLINNSIGDGKGLNFICLDESLDSLDERGKKVCLNILKMFDLTTLVVSHENIQGLIDDYNSYIVQYKDGKSFVLK